MKTIKTKSGLLTLPYKNLLLLSVLIGWLSFCLQAEGQSTSNTPNLVPNPGFEDIDKSGWVAPWADKSPMFTVSTEAPHTGTRCLRFENYDPKNYTLCSAPLKLKTGKRYEISGWVRSENVSGEDTGATLCVEWYGRNGEYLGGTYLPGVKGTNREWQRISGRTDPIPENVVHTIIACYLRKGMTGVAWWDDLKLIEYVTPLVDGITTNLYRNATAGGQVLAKAGLNLVANGLSPGDVKTNLEILNSQQRVVIRVAAHTTNENEAAFSFDATQLAPSIYDLRCVVRSKDDRPLGQVSCRLKRLAKNGSYKAWIDEYRRLILNGEPFFPLGTYWSSISKEQMHIYAQSAFNCLMPYASPSREQLDLAQNLGLKVIYSLKDYYAGTQYCPPHIKSVSDERPAIEKKVKEVGNHPAIMAWYINDELPLSMTERLTAHRDWLEELDPEHPTWSVLNQVYDLRSYLPTFDVVGTDPYPIPAQPANTALNYSRLTNSATFGYRALWMVPQIMNWAAYKTDPEEIKKFRAPTFEEMRAMAWQCIAAGANGLIFYSWFDLFHEGKVEPFQQRWGDICRMAEEIKRFFPVLLAVDAAPQPTKVDAPEDLAWRVYGKDGDIYLLAVNSGTAPIEALFLFPVEFAKATNELGVETVPLAGNEVLTAFKGLEPKIIRLTPKQR